MGNNPDNNKQFHAQRIVMTVNDTLSITNALRADRPDDYYENTVTIQWPNGPGGKPPAIENSVYPVLVFKDAQNATAAKEFIAFLLSEGRLGGFNEASLGRVLPPMPALLETPFWQDAKDPHRTAAVKQVRRPVGLLLRRGFRERAPCRDRSRVVRRRSPRRRGGLPGRQGRQRSGRAGQGDPGTVGLPYARQSRGIIPMIHIAIIVALLLAVGGPALGSEAPPAWAYPVNPPGLKPAPDDGTPRHVPDSDAAFTLTRIRICTSRRIGTLRITRRCPTSWRGGERRRCWRAAHAIAPTGRAVRKTPKLPVCPPCTSCSRWRTSKAAPEPRRCPKGRRPS